MLNLDLNYLNTKILKLEDTLHLLGYMHKMIIVHLRLRNVIWNLLR